jgi:hypothetical protein
MLNEDLSGRVILFCIGFTNAIVVKNFIILDK